MAGVTVPVNGCFSFGVWQFTNCFIVVSFLLRLGCLGVACSIAATLAAATATLVNCFGFLCVLSFGLSDCFLCWLIVLVPK